MYVCVCRCARTCVYVYVLVRTCVRCSMHCMPLLSVAKSWSTALSPHRRGQNPPVLCKESLIIATWPHIYAVLRGPLLSFSICKDVWRRSLDDTNFKLNSLLPRQQMTLAYYWFWWICLLTNSQSYAYIFSGIHSSKQFVAIHFVSLGCLHSLLLYLTISLSTPLLTRTLSRVFREQKHQARHMHNAILSHSERLFF